MPQRKGVVSCTSLPCLDAAVSGMAITGRPKIRGTPTVRGPVFESCAWIELFRGENHKGLPISQVLGISAVFIVLSSNHSTLCHDLPFFYSIGKFISTRTSIASAPLQVCLSSLCRHRRIACVHLAAMPIRNPFARRPGAGPAQDEGEQPGLDNGPPGFERVDTIGSKASIRSGKSQDTGEYKMSGA